MIVFLQKKVFNFFLGKNPEFYAKIMFEMGYRNHPPNNPGRWRFAFSRVFAIFSLRHTSIGEAWAQYEGLYITFPYAPCMEYLPTFGLNLW